MATYNPSIATLANRMVERLEDAGHCAESAAALSVAERDELLDVAAWGGDEDAAWADALQMLPSITERDAELGLRFHVHRHRDRLIGRAFLGTVAVFVTEADADSVDGHLDVQKLAAFRDIVATRFATCLMKLLALVPRRWPSGDVTVES